ncbi:hypothetical protein HK104_010023 [Borealophlyctis nickersoniae]|nr:hypothetical protein HK104_010023 [Borealophlyctis nickersoniae]
MEIREPQSPAVAPAAGPDAEPSSPPVPLTSAFSTLPCSTLRNLPPSLTPGDVETLVSRACDGPVAYVDVQRDPVRPFNAGQSATVFVERENDARRIVKMFDGFDVEDYVIQGEFGNGQDADLNGVRRKGDMSGWVVKVDGLNEDASWKDVQELVNRAISKGKAVYGKKVALVRGTGTFLVRMDGKTGAEEAIELLDESEYKGRKIQVTLHSEGDESEDGATSSTGTPYVPPTDATDYAGRLFMIENLPLDAQYTDVESLLNKYCGQSRDVCAAMLETEDGRSTGRALAGFRYAEDGVAAKNALNGKKLFGLREFRMREAEQIISETEYGHYIYIRFLPRDATEDEINNLFGQYGTLLATHLFYGRQGVPRGSAIIRFENSADGRHAAVELDNRQLRGNRLRVEVQKDFGPAMFVMARNTQQKLIPRKPSRRAQRTGYVEDKSLEQDEDYSNRKDYKGLLIEIKGLNLENEDWARLEELLQPFDITSVTGKRGCVVTLLPDDDGQSSGHAFACFRSQRLARAAWRALDGMEVFGATISVVEPPEAAEGWGTYVAVHSLSKLTSRVNLDRLCARYGQVEDTEVWYGGGGVHQRHGIVKFAKAADGLSCVENMNGEEFRGLRLRVEVDPYGPASITIAHRIRISSRRALPTRPYTFDPEIKSYKGRIIALENLALSARTKDVDALLAKTSLKPDTWLTVLFEGKLGKCMGRALIGFISEEDANTAKEHLDGARLLGRDLEVTRNPPEENEEWGQYIGVYNISVDTDRIDLFELFAREGKVTGAEVYYGSGGRRLQSGIVRYAAGADGLKAVTSLQNYNLRDRDMVLEVDHFGPVRFRVGVNVRMEVERMERKKPVYGV